MKLSFDLNNIPYSGNGKLEHLLMPSVNDCPFLLLLLLNSTIEVMVPNL